MAKRLRGFRTANVGEKTRSGESFAVDFPFLKETGTAMQNILDNIKRKGRTT